jgi:hypothetical protein
VRADCRVTERIDRGRWTGGTAQGYRTCMFKPTLLIPLSFILSAGCKDDEPTAKFGEPCGFDESEPDCADGLQCEGYCAPLCEQDSDCPTIEGYRHECLTIGVCASSSARKLHSSCPQTLGTPMKCGVGLCERDGS